MTREQNIPLFLWVAAAILAHLTWGGGAEQVAEVLEERAEVRQFAAAVQRHLLDKYTTEITLFEDPGMQEDVHAPKPPLEASEVKAEDEAEPPEDPKVQSKKSEEAKREKPVPPKKRDEPAEKEKPLAKKEEKKKEEKKKEEEEKEAEKLAVPELPPQPKMQEARRVAVDQHVEDPNQEDNPSAEFIGDKANHVEKQTQARITATDQNDPKPTPGSQHFGPTEEPGDSHVTELAQSEDRAGELNRAHSEDKAAALSEESVSSPAGVPEVAGVARGGPAESDPGQKAVAAVKAVEEQLPSPEIVNAEGGSWASPEERKAAEARAAKKAREYRAARAKGNPAKPLDFLGLGAEGVTERGVNLNLTPGTALAAIGQDRLQRDIQADGERRRSKHRGSWKAVGIERWRPAIENYVATVQPGNQTSLNTAHRPFASYLNRIHNRLHPIFAINYLGFLDSLPGSAGLRDNFNEMKTNLEIVLSQQNGSIVKMGVTRSSGNTVFDISALESVQKASPFGPPPSSIVSPDGNVYLHWEFHRNPIYACSTYFARPYIIKAPQQTAPPEPSQPFAPEEGGKRGHLRKADPEGTHAASKQLQGSRRGDAEPLRGNRLAEHRP